LPLIILFYIVSCYVTVHILHEHLGEAACADKGVGEVGGVAAAAGGEGGCVNAVYGMAEGSRARHCAARSLQASSSHESQFNGSGLLPALPLVLPETCSSWIDPVSLLSAYCPR
jgi:hypothetical protein